MPAGIDIWNSRAARLLYRQRTRFGYPRQDGYGWACMDNKYPDCCMKPATWGPTRRKGLRREVATQNISCPSLLRFRGMNDSMHGRGKTRFTASPQHRHPIRVYTHAPPTLACGHENNGGCAWQQRSRTKCVCDDGLPKVLQPLQAEEGETAFIIPSGDRPPLAAEKPRLVFSSK